MEIKEIQAQMDLAAVVAEQVFQVEIVVEMGL
jgi:hypothetical protein